MKKILLSVITFSIALTAQVNPIGNCPPDSGVSCIPYLDSRGNLKIGNTILGRNGLPAQREVAFDRSYFTDLSDFTVIGTAPTIVNGAVRLSASSTNFDSAALEIPSYVTAGENYDFEVTIKASTYGQYGLFFGQRNLNPYYTAEFSFQWITGGSTDTFQAWKRMHSTWTATQGGVVSTTHKAATGDYIKFIYSRRGPALALFVNNLTQFYTDKYLLISNLALSQNFVQPATSVFRICVNGGTWDILSIRILNRDSSPDVVVIGDSKTSYDSSGAGLRWPSRLSRLGNVAVYAGAGDRTIEAIQGIGAITALAPPYAIMGALGRNDLNTSVDAGVWQANYASIVTALKAVGTKVVHLLPIPETLQDQTALTNWIIATYPNDPKIDPSVGWVNATHLSGSVHPSQDGHRFIANAVLTSGVIPIRTNARSVDVPPWPQLFPPISW